VTVSLETPDDVRREGGREGGIDHERKANDGEKGNITYAHPFLPPSLPPFLPPSLPPLLQAEEVTNIVAVGNKEELERMATTLNYGEKGMVRVQGIFEST